MTYTELAQQTKDWKAAITPALRPESGFKYVGTEQKRVDLKEKVTGKPIYGIDTDLPNMVYGAVLYAPYIGGVLKKADVSVAKTANNVLAVVEDKQWIDAGKIINPDGVRQQVEGATMMAMSAALYEEIHIEDSQIVETNFHNYRVVRLADAPQIEVLMHEGTSKPYGVGEPPMSPIAPAIANAVFNLTGKRLRSLPLQGAFEALG